MRERIGHGSAERCEKAWRGLTNVEGQNGSRTEPAKSDNHNVMSSDQEDACVVGGLSFLNVYSLLTSRPIRIEGSRDVRGRRETQRKSGAGRRDSAVLSPAPRGPCCYWQEKNKERFEHNAAASHPSFLPLQRAVLNSVIVILFAAAPALMRL
ncbi:hypothetical protein NDU88_002963 [Pleurodeles waltl]|uniref:Uncharacterized protein n=1 Tax=Pleurodeles waltl TaxID=8319 RepID=A0AAV7VFZ8_PLEWA|nr:hypothetical protein NDU88_002963 [Pleurodeles waltl]